jgi:hypothetical protein
MKLSDEPVEHLEILNFDQGVVVVGENAPSRTAVVMVFEHGKNLLFEPRKPCG